MIAHCFLDPINSRGADSNHIAAILIISHKIDFSGFVGGYYGVWQDSGRLAARRVSQPRPDGDRVRVAERNAPRPGQKSKVRRRVISDGQIVTAVWSVYSNRSEAFRQLRCESR